MSEHDDAQLKALLKRHFDAVATEPIPARMFMPIDKPRRKPPCTRSGRFCHRPEMIRRRGARYPHCPDKIADRQLTAGTVAAVW